MRRDKATLAMMVGIPVLQLVLFGYAINTDPKHLPTAVIANELRSIHPLHFCGHCSIVIILTLLISTLPKPRQISYWSPVQSILCSPFLKTSTAI